MQISYATEPTPGNANEDYVTTGPGWIIVLDGATPPKGVESGCIHDVPWLVTNLAREFAALVMDNGDDLAALLEVAISRTCERHADTCDLSNPASPSSTVAAVRRQGDHLECLSLADSSIVLDLQGGVRTVIDDRTAHLRSYTVEAVREARNTDGGFWVASTVPEAAQHAVTVTVPYSTVRRAAVLSDGGARYVERFGLGDWTGLLDVLTDAGPEELIRRVRRAEAQETHEERQRERRRGKQHDDATAALLTP